MKNIKVAVLSTLAYGLAASLSSASVIISLTNADFESGTAGDADVSGWDDQLGSGTATLERISTQDSGLTGNGLVAQFQARDGNYLQQAFQTSEATADSFGDYTVSLDTGWRSNTSAPNDLSLEIAIYNITDDFVLASDTYVFPPNTPDNGFDDYRLLESGATFNLNFDNTQASLLGDSIGLRMTLSTSQDGFNPSGWIDNVSVSAIPEPGTAWLIGALGFLGLLRRRR